MKRAILLSILLAILFLPKSNAQHFSFVTSFGVTQSWGMPYEVVHAIEHDYWGYDVIHTRRINHHGKLFFDVVLQRGDVFVNVSIGRYGRIFNRVVTYDYPFHNHVCNSFCGYHSNFYRRNVVTCNSHHHHGHNHVTYVNYNNHYNHPGNGHAYGHYKSKGNKHYDNHGHRNDYRDTNSYKSRQNSRDYQNRSTNYVVENSRDSNGGNSYKQSRSNSGNAGNSRTYNSRSSTRSDNSKSSTNSSARTSSSSSSGRSYSGSSGRTRAN